MNLYKELEVETGQSCGVFQPGSLYLAQTEEREHQLRLQEAKARLYGLNFHEVLAPRLKNYTHWQTTMAYAASCLNPTAAMLTHRVSPWPTQLARVKWAQPLNASAR